MFMVLEGADGCGKSTHARLIAGWLRDMGRETLLTFEPTESPIGALIREVLSGRLEVEPQSLALLFTADRSQHVKQIRESLNRGCDVVCERYYHSTVAYQAAQGVDRRWLLEINSFAPEPDLTILLETDPETAAKRTFTGEIFEKKEFLQRVQREYGLFPGLIKISTSDGQEAVQERMREIIRQRLNIL
jgi:dTMP kinase